MPLRHVAAGDGEEARESGFRCKQVVVRGIEPARTVGVGEPVPDGKELAVRVVEEPEAHLVGEAAGALSEQHRAATCRAARRRSHRVHWPV